MVIVGVFLIKFGSDYNLKVCSRRIKLCL